jgi:hypothetical protein
MRILAGVTLTLMLSGCASGLESNAPICAGTVALRASHAAALAVDGNPAAMSTGRALIATIDAACKGGAR